MRNFHDWSSWFTILRLSVLPPLFGDVTVWRCSRSFVLLYVWHQCWTNSASPKKLKNDKALLPMHYSNIPSSVRYQIRSKYIRGTFRSSIICRISSTSLPPLFHSRSNQWILIPLRHREEASPLHPWLLRQPTRRLKIQCHSLWKKSGAGKSGRVLVRLGLSTIWTRKSIRSCYGFLRATNSFGSFGEISFGMDRHPPSTNEINLCNVRNWFRSIPHQNLMGWMFRKSRFQAPFLLLLCPTDVEVVHKSC